MNPNPVYSEFKNNYKNIRYLCKCIVMLGPYMQIIGDVKTVLFIVMEVVLIKLFGNTDGRGLHTVIYAH